MLADQSLTVEIEKEKSKAAPRFYTGVAQHFILIQLPWSWLCIASSLWDCWLALSYTYAWINKMPLCVLSSFMHTLAIKINVRAHAVYLALVPLVFSPFQILTASFFPFFLTPLFPLARDGERERELQMNREKSSCKLGEILLCSGKKVFEYYYASRSVSHCWCAFPRITVRLRAHKQPLIIPAATRQLILKADLTFEEAFWSSKLKCHNSCDS